MAARLVIPDPRQPDPYVMRCSSGTLPRMRINLTSGLGRLVARLAVASLLIQLFVTALFLPSMSLSGPAPSDKGATASGVTRVVICTGSGFRTILVNHDGQPVDPADRGDGGILCPICLGLSAVAALEAPVIVFPAAPKPVAPVVTWVAQAASQDMAYGLPMVRGPPRSAFL